MSCHSHAFSELFEVKDDVQHSKNKAPTLDTDCKEQNFRVPHVFRSVLQDPVNDIGLVILAYFPKDLTSGTYDSRVRVVVRSPQSESGSELGLISNQ